MDECWLEAVSGRSGFSILTTSVLALMRRISDSKNEGDSQPTLHPL